jgi:hypothetical protein
LRLLIELLALPSKYDNCVLTIYLDSCNVRANGKVYTRVLLRQSFRKNGKVKHRTIANLSKCAPEEIAAIKLAFEHKHDLEALARTAAERTCFTLLQGPSAGAVAVLLGLAGELGITAALGDDRQGIRAGERRGHLHPPRHPQVSSRSPRRHRPLLQGAHFGGDVTRLQAGEFRLAHAGESVGLNFQSGAFPVHFFRLEIRDPSSTRP